MLIDARTGERFPLSGSSDRPASSERKPEVPEVLRLELDALHMFTLELMQRLQVLEAREGQRSLDRLSDGALEAQASSPGRLADRLELTDGSAG